MNNNWFQIVKKRLAILYFRKVTAAGTLSLLLLRRRLPSRVFRRRREESRAETRDLSVTSVPQTERENEEQKTKEDDHSGSQLMVTEKATELCMYLCNYELH